MLEARMERKDVRVMRTPAQLHDELAAGLFKPATFADVRTCATARVRVRLETVQLPPLLLAERIKTEPIALEAEAFGARWRLSAVMRDAHIVLCLRLLEPAGLPPGWLTVTRPADTGALAAAAQLLPVNILLQVGDAAGAVVSLDSHAVFGSGPEGPRTWSQELFWDTLKASLKLQLQQLRRQGRQRPQTSLCLTLQAVRILG
jgi:hypothetical protein